MLTDIDLRLEYPVGKLKDMEEHQLIKRTINYEETIEYTLHPYAKTLKKAVDALRDWGVNHRKQILSK